MILMAGLGAVVAAAALFGRLSGRLADRTVDRLYYVSYGCTAVSVALFVVQGLFGGRS